MFYYLCKYKALNSLTDLTRLLDILRDNRIYMPLLNELNDPYEGLIYHKLEFDGWAGKSLCEDNEILITPIKNELSKFRVLSLSELYLSDLMWAHYANNFSGVCLCYNFKGAFEKAMPVFYYDDTPEREPSVITSEEHLSKILKKSMFVKKSCWNYEREWRILSDNSDATFFNYRTEDLACMIIGHRVDKRIADVIAENVPKGIPVMTCYCGKVSKENYLLPYGYEKAMDGGVIPKVYDLKQFIDEYRNENKTERGYNG